MYVKQKAALNAVASKTIAYSSNIYHKGFRCTFFVGPSGKCQGSIVVFLLFLLFVFDKKELEPFKQRGVVVKALEQSNKKYRKAPTTLGEINAKG